MDILPLSETLNPRKNKLGQISGTPTKKLSGQPTKGLLIPPKVLRVTSKGYVNEEEIGLGATPGTAAKVGATLGLGTILETAARVRVTLGSEASLGATVELGANTVPKATQEIAPCVP